MSADEQSLPSFEDFEASRRVFPEMAPSPNILGQLTLADVVPVYNRLTVLSDESLQSRLAVREQGASNDMLTHVYAAGLTQWQRSEGRLPDDAATFWHRVGLLFGTQLVTDRYRATTGLPLSPDNSDAYSFAQDFTCRSYVLNHEDKFRFVDFSPTDYVNSLPPWDREKGREASLLGSTTLMLMNVLLRERAGVGATDESPINANRQVALYTGMLDTVIFSEAYANFRHGITLEAKNWMEIGSKPWAHNYAIRERQPDGSFREPPLLHISPLDGLTAAVRRLQLSAKDFSWRQVCIGDEEYPALLVRSVVQRELDQFEQVHSIIALLRRPDQPYPWDLLPGYHPFAERLRSALSNAARRDRC